MSARALIAASAVALALALAGCHRADHGSPATCDLGAGPCTLSGDPGGIAVTLDVAPRPVRSMTDLSFTVDLSRGGAPVAVADVALSLAMPGMYMGENRVSLAPQGGGRYAGQGVVVRCPSGHRLWAAEVSVRPPTGAPARATFTLEAAER